MTIFGVMSNPGQTIIERLGGVDLVADALGINHVTVRRWAYPRARRGTGGIIPHWHHKALMELAKQQGVSLSPADFVSLVDDSETPASPEAA